MLSEGAIGGGQQRNQQNNLAEDVSRGSQGKKSAEEVSRGSYQRESAVGPSGEVIYFFLFFFSVDFHAIMVVYLW